MQDILPSDTKKNPKDHCKALFDEELEVAPTHLSDDFHEGGEGKIELDEQNEEFEGK